MANEKISEPTEKLHLIVIEKTSAGEGFLRYRAKLCQEDKTGNLAGNITPHKETAKNFFITLKNSLWEPNDR